MIRKLIVAAAVLGLAGSGAVAQGVSFSGEGDLGVVYTGQEKNAAGEIMNESKISWRAEFDIAMAASGTTDGGLTFGGGAKINAGNGENGTGKSSVGAANAYIGGESWKISIGDLDPASHKGQSLGDIGFDGLDVDDVAEKAVDATAADVEVSFSLGAASLAITAGQTGGSPREMTRAASKRMTTIYTLNTTAGTGGIFPSGGTHIATVEDGQIFDGSPGNFDTDDNTPDTRNRFYIHRNDDGDAVIYQVVGKEKDSTPGVGEGRTDTNNDGNINESDTADATTDDVVATKANLGHAGADEVVRTDDIPGMEADYKDAEKQDTQWAAGVSFDIGSTTLGIGIDSEKLMQASVSADLGAFTGKLFYAQQKKNDGKTSESKDTGMGVEIGVSAGANTNINAVYAQGKTDYKDAGMSDTTDKGFGVGVSHGLGGGATLNAGFAKVKKVTKASVGVSMSF